MDASTQTWSLNDMNAQNLEQTARGAVSQANSLAEGTASKVPSLLFPIAALASIAASATLQLLGRRQAALFVGQWAPSFLLFGLWNKMVKSVGAD